MEGKVYEGDWKGVIGLRGKFRRDFKGLEVYGIQYSQKDILVKMERYDVLLIE